MDNKQNKAKNVDANVAATTEEEWHEDWNDGTLEEVLASVEPKIFIHDIVDKENGGCDIDFETNKAFDEWYKKEKGVCCGRGDGRFFSRGGGGRQEEQEEEEGSDDRTAAEPIRRRRCQEFHGEQGRVCLCQWSSCSNDRCRRTLKTQVQVSGQKPRKSQGRCDSPSDQDSNDAKDP